MATRARWRKLAVRLNSLISSEASKDDLKDALAAEAPLNIALALQRLPQEQIGRVFDELDEASKRQVLAKLGPDDAVHAIKHIDAHELSSLVENLPLREAAETVAAAPPEMARELLTESALPAKTIADVENRLSYPVGSAGRLMTRDFVRLSAHMTAAEAIEAVRQTDPSRDLPNNLYVVEKVGARERLLGALSIRDLVMCRPHCKIRDAMATSLVTLPPEAEDDEAANLLAKLKFLALPIVDAEGMLLGVIPADDLMEVVVARLGRRYAQSIGADAEAMELMSPLGAAKARTPWLIGTMLLELAAGLVIAHFSHVLQQVILLASFMPVISAVSGNVGLQAAAITVRALDTGQVRLSKRSAALAKESMTSLLMALVCGLLLGAIAVAWSGHLVLGVVIGVAMACSMLTAGLMGTVIPMASKSLGFDPATTAGPFETAFQDIIGFGVFLGLATATVGWIS